MRFCAQIGHDLEELAVVDHPLDDFAHVVGLVRVHRHDDVSSSSMRSAGSSHGTLRSFFEVVLRQVGEERADHLEALRSRPPRPDGPRHCCALWVMAPPRSSKRHFFPGDRLMTSGPVMNMWLVRLHHDDEVGDRGE